MEEGAENEQQSQGIPKNKAPTFLVDSWSLG